MNKIIRSAPFVDVFWARSVADGSFRQLHREPCEQESQIKVRAYLAQSERVVLVGDTDKLGQWDPSRGVEMHCSKLPLWCCATDMIERGDQYKFVVINGQGIVRWEEGNNRIYDGWRSLEADDFRGLPDSHPRFAGVAIPVFSIRTGKTEGIGDFLALGEIAAWAARTGQRVVQTLPVNDTTVSHTRRDSYPYSSISIYALHPLYIRLSEFGLQSAELRRLDALPHVDYDAVDAEKWRLLREAYQRDGEKDLASQDFADFFECSGEWLRPYAVFSFLRDKFSTAVYADWPAPYSEFSERMLEDILVQNPDQIKLYYFIQYHADRQLRAARDAAHDVGVVLKGDIPIGVSRHSVEAWSEPNLFNLDEQAGAPPDAFSTEGQNWGFPTYNWEPMAKDGYQWWVKRFRKMADYFDMYRIDHILGFFRIWAIPTPEKSGLMGQFSPSLPFSSQELASWGLPMYEERYLGVDDTDRNTLFVRDHKTKTLYHPRIGAQFTDIYTNRLDQYEKDRFDALYNHYFYERHNRFWADEALKKLPHLIDATNMLCCAEDLGMIPSSVASTLNELQIVSLEIERMPKQDNQSFAQPSQYPYMSVCTTSTHDMSPIRQWWIEDRAKTQQYYNDVMCWHGAAFDQATVDICRNIVSRHLDSPSLAAILPLQDWLSIDEHLWAEDPCAERINVPSDPNHYWCYRMHIDVARLLESTAYNDLVLALVRNSGRVI